MGVAQYFKQTQQKAKIIALASAASAVISSGQVGRHNVEGIGVDFVPLLLKKGLFNEVVVY